MAHDDFTRSLRLSAMFRSDLSWSLPENPSTRANICQECLDGELEQVRFELVLGSVGDKYLGFGHAHYLHFIRQRPGPP